MARRPIEPMPSFDEYCSDVEGIHMSGFLSTHGRAALGDTGVEQRVLVDNFEPTLQRGSRGQDASGLHADFLCIGALLAARFRRSRELTLCRLRGARLRARDSLRLRQQNPEPVPPGCPFEFLNWENELFVLLVCESLLGGDPARAFDHWFAPVTAERVAAALTGEGCVCYTRRGPALYLADCTLAIAAAWKRDPGLVRMAEDAMERFPKFLSRRPFGPYERATLTVARLIAEGAPASELKSALAEQLRCHEKTAGHMNITHINALYTWGSKYGKELATDFVALAFAGIPSVRALLGSVTSRSLPDYMKDWLLG